MEKMTNEIMQLIDELHMLNIGRKGENAVKDRYGFSFEPLNCVSTVPLDFTERTMRLQVEAREAYRLTLKFNRHSPLFIRTSGLLERLLNHLGSYCITKAVLEAQGETFDLIDTLDIVRLREMTAANFRKCNESFMENQMIGHFYPKIFALSLRWAELDRRLEATAEKIEKIKTGKIKIDLTEKEHSSETRIKSSSEQETNTAPLPSKAAALPIDKTAIGEAEKRAAAEAPAEQPDETVTTGDDPVVQYADPDDSAEAETGNSKTEPAQLSEVKEEAFKRHLLLQDAVDRADRDAYEAAYMARGPALDDLWQSFLKRDENKGFPALKRMGVVLDPSDPPPTAAELSQQYEPIAA